MNSKICAAVAAVYLFWPIACGDRRDNAGNRTCVCLEESRAPRSDDVDPVIAVLDRHSQQITELTARLQALESKSQRKVAFSAHFTADGPTSDIGPAKTLIFDSVAVNIGGAYDSATGIVRAPYAGEYVFHVKILSQNSYGIRVDVVTTPNSAIITTTEVWAKPERQVATAQSTVYLSAGQPVWVVAYPLGMNPPLTQLYGSVYSSFSGFLLYPD